MPGDSHTISFTVYAGGERQHEETFDRAVVSVGKLSTSNLRIDDVNVSRKHAVIEHLEDGRWRVTDLGSTNGTTVEGKRVTQAVIGDGDRIIVGSTTIVVHLPEVTAADADPGSAGAAKPAREIDGLGTESFYEGGDRGGAEGTPMVLELALLWGDTVVNIQHFDHPRAISLGEADGCDFLLPAEILGVDSVQIISEVDDAFALNVADAGATLDGDVLRDGQVYSIADLDDAGLLAQGYLPLADGTRARIRFGEFLLLISYGPMPHRPPLSPLGAVDFSPHIYVALSAIVHIAFLVILSLLPEEQLRSRIDPAANRARLINVLKVTQPEQIEPEEEDEKERLDRARKEKAEKDRMKVDERLDQRKRDRGLLDKLAQRERDKSDMLTGLTSEQRRQKAKEVAQETATRVLDQDTALFQNLLADSDQALSDEANIRILASNAEGGSTPLAAAGAIDPFGGTLQGDINQGFVGDASVGGARDPNSGLVRGMGSKRRGKSIRDVGLQERKLTPTVISSKPLISGKLDRETVRKIIRRNISGIKWCYQDALQRDRSIKGKIGLAFTILPTGKVSGAKATNPSIRDTKLLSCIAKRVSRWKFPQPKDGGVVKVTYPLILKTR